MNLPELDVELVNLRGTTGARVGEYPRRVLQQAGGRTATYRRVEHQAAAMVAELSELGIESGDRNGIAAQPRAEPNVMQGYCSRIPAETARSISPEGFFFTGGLGIIDDEGYLIDDACVIGVSHAIMGELVCACIGPVEGCKTTERSSAGSRSTTPR